MAESLSDQRIYIVYRENDPAFNRHVSQSVDSIISNAVLRVTADKTASGRVSPNNEENIRKFASDYVNDVIIPGAIKKIETENSQQSSASNNQDLALKMFVKNYVNDVIIPGAISKLQNLSNGDDDDSNINDIVDSTIHNYANTVSQEEQDMDTFTGGFVGETLHNIAFNPSQLLLDHHRHIMKLYVKETKQKVHALLQKQRQNYLELKSMMNQATHGQIQRSKMSQISLYSCEILKKFCDPIQINIPDLSKHIQKETPDSVNPIQQDTSAILELNQQDAPAILELSQLDTPVLVNHPKQDTSDVIKPQTISKDLPAKKPGKKNPFRSIARSVIGRVRLIIVGCTKPNKRSPDDSAEYFLISY